MPVRLVIADEPTPGLHPDAVAEVLGHLRELAASGAAVLLITHDLIAAAGVSQRIAVMHGCVLLAVENAADFTAGGEIIRHPFARALWRALPHQGFAHSGSGTWH